MPTYDYVCRACGHEFELFQSITAPVQRKCPKCGKLKLERLIGVGAGVIFKGSGFYETDYRSESYKKAAEQESKSATGGDGKKDAAPKTADNSADAKPVDSATTAAKSDSTAAPETDASNSSTRLTITPDSSKADVREAKKLLKHKQQMREKRRAREAESKKKAARKKT
ncbi:MAG: zinc ribbon domain-containing protein [Phycisphaerales bacterium]|nr:zinc ribbon domain-containing protein [Phycisphaerales bacterium]